MLMRAVFFIAILMIGCGVAFFSFYQLLLAIASVGQQRRHRSLPVEVKHHPRFLVLVPAHDEERLIAASIRSILSTSGSSSRIQLIVVADNCSDSTASIAKQEGADCWERKDSIRRGKPHALAWAIERCRSREYDYLVVLDADSEVRVDFFEGLTEAMADGIGAVQAYFDVLNPDETWLTRLSVLPATVKFKLQYPGKERLGLSCPLAGNGMCFRKSVLAERGWNAFSLTENWEYWAMLSLRGIRVGAAPNARLYAQDTKSLSTSRSQRERWAMGRSATSAQYVPKLLKAALAGQHRLMALDAVVELVRPSHALLMVESFGFVFLAAVGGHWLSLPSWPLAVATAVLLSQALLFVAALIMDRAPVRTWVALVMVPWYLIWKLAISISAVAKKSRQEWIRTERH